MVAVHAIQGHRPAEDVGRGAWNRSLHAAWLRTADRRRAARIVVRLNQPSGRGRQLEQLEVVAGHERRHSGFRRVRRRPDGRS